VGGHAHAARDIVEGFAHNARVAIEFQPIDPRWHGAFGFLTQWKFIRSIVRPLLYLRGVVAACRRADVIHVFAAAHTAFLFGAMPAILVAKWVGKPIILNYHDGRAEAHFRWWSPLLRWAARQAAILVFPSNYLQDVFARRGFNGVVVPNVVNTDAFRYRTPEPVPPRLISARLLERLYAADPGGAADWSHSAEGGGRAVGEACHMVDFLYSLADDEPVVDLQVLSLAAAGERPDANFSAQLRFANGTLATLIYTTRGHRSLPKERIEVMLGGEALIGDDFRNGTVHAGAGVRLFPDRVKLDKGLRDEWAVFHRACVSGMPFPIALATLRGVAETTFRIREAAMC
jgi:hypothetical protein